ncbi:MAG: VCBS repeat-containing protein [Verrucomicrobiota bacterium]|nr:VCBS repeat-containing protein [Verrucomicrobiota bacterium]
MRIHTLISIALITVGLWSCSGKKEEKKTIRIPVTLPEWQRLSEAVSFRPLAERRGEEGTRFTRLGKQETGIDFQNHVERKNIRNYLLNGAGLTVGDIDNDGWPDLFLVCQDGPNRLYRQVAPWKFEDITMAAGIEDHNAWGSGACFADLDNDGDLDLFVCNKGAANEFYLNSGNGKFTGGRFSLYAPQNASPTMAAPADYDRDGDLDLYVTANRLFDFKELFNHKIEVIQDTATGKRRVPPPFDEHCQYNEGNILVELGSPDVLVRNDGGQPGSPPILRSVPHAKSGLSPGRDHGLAAVWFDINNDQWPDLYVSNDFSSPDHLYLNTGDTFSDVTGEVVPYTSFYSMGSDFADINNDGWIDYLSTDMSSTTHYKQKTMMGLMERSQWFLDNLEPRQQMRNVLHINTGAGKFISAEFFAGLDSTDWTWGAMFGDLDNDGLEDVYITNGMERNIQDADLAARSIKMNKMGVSKEKIREEIRNAPRLPERNLVFRNLGDLRFAPANDSWKLTEETVSHGGLLCDIDRDGDLDIITNNMNEPVTLLRNESGPQNEGILVSLVGKKSNRFGLGARVVVQTSMDKHTRILTSSRGYASGCEPVVHFGLGTSTEILKLTVFWPSGAEQILENLATGRHYRISEPANAPVSAPPAKPLSNKGSPVLFNELPASGSGLDFTHVENRVDDFATQPLLPNKLSRFGPALCAGDFNGDGLEDVFAGGAAGSAGELFLRHKDGKFLSAPAGTAFTDYRHSEDIAAVALDADNDGDEDIYVVSGGNHADAQSPLYQDRLYLNQGSGKFMLAPEGSLPKMRESGSCVAAADIDRDGDIDLFVGARLVPGNYPMPPVSRLLLNNGGRFTLATSAGLAPEGMITGAVFSDIDADGWMDLVTCMEWGPISVWKNTGGTFTNIDSGTGMASLSGWWNGISAGDIDGDGDPDFIATNFGLNTKYHASVKHPALLYAADFGNGHMNVVEAEHTEGKIYPVRGKSCSTHAMPFLQEKFPTFHDFALATIDEIYAPAKNEGTLELKATTLSSMLILNMGQGKFQARALPVLAQLSPAFGSVMHDFDGDGHLDVVIGQNFYHPQRETGRMNAGLNVFLKGNGKGELEAIWPSVSGLLTRDDSRNLLLIDDHSHPLLLSAPNNSRMRAFTFGQ